MNTIDQLREAANLAAHNRAESKRQLDDALQRYCEDDMASKQASYALSKALEELASQEPACF